MRGKFWQCIDEKRTSSMLNCSLQVEWDYCCLLPEIEHFRVNPPMKSSHETFWSFWIVAPWYQIIQMNPFLHYSSLYPPKRGNEDGIIILTSLQVIRNLPSAVSASYLGVVRWGVPPPVVSDRRILVCCGTSSKGSPDPLTPGERVIEKRLL